MRWKVPEPSLLGDLRVRRTFALLPIRINHTTKVWLERYWVTEEFTRESKKLVYRYFWTVVQRHLNKPELLK